MYKPIGQEMRKVAAASFMSYICVSNGVFGSNQVNHDEKVFIKNFLIFNKVMVWKECKFEKLFYCVRPTIVTLSSPKNPKDSE